MPSLLASQSSAPMKEIPDDEDAKRLELTREHKYHVNCLALEHSNESCFSEIGCNHCQKPK